LTKQVVRQVDGGASSAALLLRVYVFMDLPTSGCRVADQACSDMPVLLVEDEDAFRVGLGEMLREDGHDVLEYPEPARLPQLGVLGHVSLLLCDYEMPGQNGLVLADRFHAAHPAVPIILLTGCRAYSLQREVAARDFLYLAEKPARYDDLHSLIHKVVALHPLRLREESDTPAANCH
jgi:DNA-binding NtrC family response regulator